MAISNATRLSDFGSGIGTQGAILKVDNANQRVGIGTTNPTAMFSVGPGAAIIMDGNAGVITATTFSGSGANLTGIAATGNINTNNIKVSGISTFGSGASTFPGAVSITDSTASTSTTTGALKVTGGVGIAGSLHVGENVSVGGTLTYEDVTNIDSVGIVTAQTGVRVTAGGLVVTAGVSTLGADLSIADKIVHTGDTNTAIRFPSADTITAETGGTERTRVSDLGLRIGTNSVTASTAGDDLTIEGASDRGLSIISGSTSSGNIYFGDSGDPDIGRIAYQHTDNALEFYTNASSSSNAVITSAGNLGIGTNSPSSFVSLLKSGGNAKLQLQRSNAASNTDDYGSVLWRSMQGTAVGGINVARQSAEDDGYMFFQTASGGTLAERMRITKTGGLTLDNAELIEKYASYTSSANFNGGNVNLDNGMVHYCNQNLSGGANTVNLTSSVGINTAMANGDMISLTLITAVSADTNYINHITVDHSATPTEMWIGGSAPGSGDGGTSNVDIYSFNLLKNGSNSYITIGNHIKTS